MSPIDSLEQLNLAEILQQVEALGKTGLLCVQRGEQRVELYFRKGQLMCIGPVQTNVTLGERLLRDGIISQEALQEVMSAIELCHPSETRMALTLIDLGHVNHESLRDWAATQASKVIRVLLTWSTSKMYFEENVQPADERLLISLPITSLLPPSSLPVAVPQPIGAAAISTPEQALSSGSAQDSAHIAHAPILFEAAQFFSGADIASMVPSTSSWSNAPVSDLGKNTEMLTPSLGSLTPPQRVAAPVAQRRMNTSSMQGQMVLVPTDLSGQREQNPHVSLTPEQWRIFARADGQTTLQTMCQTMGMSRDQVCQLVAELLTLGLVTIIQPASGPLNELSPISRDYINAGLSNGYVAPGHAAALAQPWAAAIMPMAENLQQFSLPAPIETQSQWGNGGNGATFHIGNGWVLAPSSSQPLQASGPLQVNNQVYAQMGGSR